MLNDASRHILLERAGNVGPDSAKPLCMRLTLSTSSPTEVIKTTRA